MKKSLTIAMLLAASFGFAQVKKTEQSGNAEIAVQTVRDTNNMIYNSAGLQVQPIYPGGISNFLDYIKANFDYNNLAPEFDKTKIARIYVQFVVEKDGTVSTIKILRDPGSGAGKEAERVIKENKTKWSPGIQNGKPVRAIYNLPITINTQKTAKTTNTEKTQKNSSTELAANEITCSATLNVPTEYPGGLTKFINDILSAIDLKNLEPGYEKQTLKVYADFVIEKDGTLTDIKIVRDPGFGYGKEIMRVMKLNKTKWSPGIKDTKPTRTSFTLPFTLEQKK
jgi:hypothetical protein